MKRLIGVFTAFVLLYFLAGCFNLVQIKTDFESLGYTQVSGGEGMIPDVVEVFDAAGIFVHISTYSDEVNYAVLLEFNSIAEMETQLESNAPLKLAISAYKDYDLIEKNFLLVPVTGSMDIAEVMIQIFHGTYEGPSGE